MRIKPHFADSSKGFRRFEENCDSGVIVAPGYAKQAPGCGRLSGLIWSGPTSTLYAESGPPQEAYDIEGKEAREYRKGQFGLDWVHKGGQGRPLCDLGDIWTTGRNVPALRRPCQI